MHYNDFLFDNFQIMHGKMNESYKGRFWNSTCEICLTLEGNMLLSVADSIGSEEVSRFSPVFNKREGKYC